jgi:hypothetical protein
MMLAGQAIVGSSVSLTVIVKLQLDWLPDKSVAVQLTIVVPMAKMLPEGGVHAIIGAGSVSSVAVAE